MSAPSNPATDEFDTGVRPDELDPERPRPFDTPWGHYALYTVEGRVVGAESFCPHMLGPLFEGTRAGSEITCPWHGWRFSLETGRCTHRPEGGSDGARIGLCQVTIGPAGTFVLHPPGRTPSQG